MLKTDSNGNLLPGEFESVELDRFTLRISGYGAIYVVGIELIGAFDMIINEEGFEMALNVKLDLAIFGEVNINAAAALLNRGSGTFFALRAEFDLEFGFAIFGFDVRALLEINTGSEDYETLGPEGMTFIIPANTVFNIELEGSIRMLAFDIEFEGSVSLVDGLFRIEIKKAAFSFFGVLNMQFSGFFQSDGQFRIRAEARLRINLGIIIWDSGFVFDVSNTGFLFSIYGSLDININLGFFKIRTTLLGFRADIEITMISAFVRGQVTVAGFTVGFSKLWSWGEDPIISTVIDGVLYLNAGARAIYREPDPNNPLYEDVINETYEIRPLFDEDGKIIPNAYRVEAFGLVQDHFGVHTIRAMMLNGNDTLIIGQGVTAHLDIHMGSGNNNLLIMGGAPGSVLIAGDGNNRIVSGFSPNITYIAGNGNNIFIGGEAPAIIRMGGGRNEISSTRGDDIIYVEGSVQTHIALIGGNNTIYADWVGALHVEGGPGLDRVILNNIATNATVFLNEREFQYIGRTITFEGSLEIIQFTDTSAMTVLSSPAVYSWDQTGLWLTAQQIDLRNASLRSPNGHFNVVAQDGVLASGDGISTHLGQLTLVNYGSAENNRDIVIRELDSLTIVDGGRVNGGLYSEHGAIDVELAGTEALFSLDSGVLRAGPAQPIRIIADDIDFRAGDNTVQGSGTLTLRAQRLNQGYRIGAAGQSIFGVDFSRSFGGRTGFMELGMRDLAAIGPGFTHITIGHQHPGVNMWIGDVKNLALSPSVVFNAALKSPASFLADRINIVGDVLSAHSLSFDARLLEVQRSNFRDPMGAPDSGIQGSEVYISLTEQLVISGWIRGDSLVRIDVFGSTGIGAMVTYGAEPNSVTADQGSTLMSLNNGSRVEMNTSHSIITATGIFAMGDHSSIDINAGTGMILLEGAVVAARGNGADVALRSQTYLHVNSGGAVTVGAKFVQQPNGTFAPVRTGNNTSLLIDTAGELRISGSVTAAGAMTLRYGETFNDNADYFDTINGRNLAEMAFSADILTALQQGLIHPDLRALFEANNLPLSLSVGVTPVANFTPFAALSPEARALVAATLGYTVFEEGGFFRPDMPGQAPFSTLVEATWTDAQLRSLALALGYTELNGTYFYNRDTNTLRSALFEGVSADYSNDQIDWAAAGVPAPAPNAGFDDLTTAQQLAVAAALGYRVEIIYLFVNPDAPIPETDRFTAYYYLAGDHWGDIDPGPEALLSELTLDQKFIASRYIGAFPEFDSREINWGAVTAPDPSDEFDRFTNAQRATVAEHLGYTAEVNGFRFVNLAAPPGRIVMESFEQGQVTDYLNEDIFWGSAGAPAAGTPFAALTLAQQRAVAHQLGYELFTGLSFFNPDAAFGSRMVQNFHSGNQIAFDRIDWGGAGAPNDRFADFDQLTLQQRILVAQTLGYRQFFGQVLVGAEDEIRLFLEVGEDYDIGEIDWEAADVASPAPDTAWEDLGFEQQNVILLEAGFRRYNGQVWFNPATDSFRLGFVQGDVSETDGVYSTITGEFDYRNSQIQWTEVQVPASGTEWEDLTADQQFRILSQTGFESFVNPIYWTPNPDPSRNLAPLMTSFIEGLHYFNNQIAWESDAEQGNRWFINDGSNQYIINAIDDFGVGTFNNLVIRDVPELFGQRGYGFLLTGTLTTLDDGQGLTVTGEQDVIIRGNINLLGENADLFLQSERWIYWEGFANVTGNITLMGGVTLDGLNPAHSPQGGANDAGISVFVHETSRLNTTRANTHIVIQGGQDVVLSGTVVAGGIVGETGVNWIQPGGSTISVSAGSQVVVDTAVTASRSVSVVTTTAPLAGRDGVGIRLTSKGGIAAAGISSSNSGGEVYLDSMGHVELIGEVLAGGQRFVDGIVWGSEHSGLVAKAAGQLWLGGPTLLSTGETVETASILRARDYIHLTGGTGRDGDGIGVKMPGAAGAITFSADSEIRIHSADDAELLGVIIAGGDVIDVQDSLGEFIGTLRSFSTGPSRIYIDADAQIRLGRDLYAGALIDLRGGTGSVKAGVPNADQGIVLFGGVGLTTGLPDSVINLSSAGNLTVLPTSWTREFHAPGFAEFASGRLSENISLALQIDFGLYVVEGTVDLQATETQGHQTVFQLIQYLNSQFAASFFDVVVAHAGSPFSLGQSRSMSDLPLTFTLREGRLFIQSNQNFTVLGSAGVGIDRLGLATVDVQGQAVKPAVDASQPGSKVMLGRSGATGGTMFINGHVIGHSGIEVVENSGQQIELGILGTFETFLGNIELRPSGDSVLVGNLIARGVNADVIIEAGDSVRIEGQIIAQRDIIVRAGEVFTPGSTSIHITPSSGFVIEGPNGRILIEGLNDVLIDSVIGLDSPSVRSIEVAAEMGTLTLARNSGQIRTGTGIVLRGRDILLEGVIVSTQATPSLNDFEVRVEATQDLNVSGDITLAGSLLFSAGRDIILRNLGLDVNAPQQRFVLDAGGDILLGTVDPASAALGESGAVVLQASRLLELTAAGAIRVAADAQLYSTAADSRILLQGGSIHLVGLARAGATFDFNAPLADQEAFTWTGPRARLELRSDRHIVLGGQRIGEGGTLVDAGGALFATGSVVLRAGEGPGGVGIQLSRLSVIRTDAAGFGAGWSASPASQVSLVADGQISIEGVIRTLDSASTVEVRSSSLLRVDSLIATGQSLTLTGGTHSSGLGVLIESVIDLGQDEVVGGVLEVMAGGQIEIRAIDSIQIHGVVGQFIDMIDAGSIVIDSTGRDVTLSGDVTARDSITILGGNITFTYGAWVAAPGDTSEIFVRGRDSIMVVGDSPAGLDAALLEAMQLIHLAAPLVTVVGFLNAYALGATVILNAGSQLQIFGTVISGGAIRAHAGVDMQAARAQLEGPIFLTNLSGGLIQIRGEGVLVAEGDVLVRSGGDIRVLADADLPNERTVLVPVIRVFEETIPVIVGYVDVAIDTIQISRTVWVETTEMELVDQVLRPVGRFFTEMDVTLEQIGYWNPNAPADRRFREFFIEGIDYFNDEVNWANAGTKELPTRSAEPVTGNYKQTGYRTFAQLTDAQRWAVLNHLGYKPLFQFTYTNARMITQIGALTTEVPVTPLWANNAPVVYAVDVDGWQDRYVRMPEGAQSDIQRLVFQNEARYLINDTTMDGNNNGTWVTLDQATGALQGEWVGVYHDEAPIWYRQDNSRFSATLATMTNAQKLRLLANVGLTDPSLLVEVDNLGPAFWTVLYDRVLAPGTRFFDMADLDGLSRTFDPEWSWVPTEAGNGNYGPGDLVGGLTAQLPAHYVSSPPLVSDDSTWTNLIRAFPDYNAALGLSTYELQLLSTVIRPNQLAATFEYNGPWVPWGGTNYRKPFGGAGSKRSIYESNTWARGTFRVATAANPEPLRAVLRNIEYNLTDGGLDAARIRPYVNWINQILNAWNNGQNLNDQYNVEHWYRRRGALHRDIIYFTINKRVVFTGTHREPFYDFQYNWVSTTREIRDRRIQLDYELVTQATTIEQMQDRFEMRTRLIPSNLFETQTVWGTQPVIGQETILRAQRELEERTFQIADFAVKSISGANLLLEANGNVHISGALLSLGDLTILSGGNLDIRGLTVTDPDTGLPVATQASVRALGELRLQAGGNLLVAAFSDVQGDEIILNANQDVTLRGTIGGLEIPAAPGVEARSATLSVRIGSGRNTLLQAEILATSEILVHAGTNSSRSGSVTADSLAILQVTGSNGLVDIRSGKFDGRINLDQSLIFTETDAGSRVVLRAEEGRILHAMERQTADAALGLPEIFPGLIQTYRLVALADNQMTLNTRVSVAELELTGAGDIDLVNLGDLTLEDVRVANGAVRVLNLGSVWIESVRALGDNDRNDIEIRAVPGNGGAANITVRHLSTPDRGDVLLEAQGWIRRAEAGAPAILADRLVVLANTAAANAVELNTNVRTLSGAVVQLGDAVFVQGVRALVVDNFRLPDLGGDFGGISGK